MIIVTKFDVGQEVHVIEIHRHRPKCSKCSGYDCRAEESVSYYVERGTVYSIDTHYSSTGGIAEYSVMLAWQMEDSTPSNFYEKDVFDTEAAALSEIEQRKAK
jgi:hypothetical protein